MKKLVEQINEVVMPCLVVKADVFGVELEKYGIYPNASDSFIISDELVKRSLSKISNTELRDISLGSKMIGSYRDKGSVTSIVKGEYKLLVDFKCEDLEEVKNLCNFLTETNKEIVSIKGTTVTFIPDVIAGTSTSRDNVNALLINGLMELDCILDDTTVEMSVEELSSITIQDLADVRNRDHKVYIADKNNNLVYDLGENLIIFESFFWQPMHDNANYISSKTINCLYHQAVDGFQIYNPNLYKAIQNSLDYESIKEDMLCLGLEIDYDIEVSEFTKEELEDIYKF